ELQAVFSRFKEIGDRKKFVYDDDLVSLVGAQIQVARETYSLESLHVASGTGEKPVAKITLKHGRKMLSATGSGDGAVDAVLKTIDRITGLKGHLMDYQVRAVTEGKDAVGEVSLSVRFDAKGEPAAGRAAATDVIESSGSPKAAGPRKRPGAPWAILNESVVARIPRSALVIKFGRAFRTILAGRTIVPTIPTGTTVPFPH
ncbi:MAG: hypothetical protein EBT68_08905, partial [Verrucomicrobia bacterium]|nr:hypothetical protein [Verrucomicrobiota bacterium]